MTIQSLRPCSIGERITVPLQVQNLIGYRSDNGNVYYPIRQLTHLTQHAAPEYWRFRLHDVYTRYPDFVDRNVGEDQEETLLTKSGMIALLGLPRAAKQGDIFIALLDL